MKSILYIFGVVMLLSMLVYAALVPVRFDSPGADGMNSNFDIQEVKPTEATYLENADIITTPGAVKRPFGLDIYGSNSHHLFGAYGYYEPTRFWKAIIGVAGLPDDGIGNFLYLTTADSFAYSLGDSSAILGILRTSDTFDLEIDGTLPNSQSTRSKQHIGYALPENYQDFTAFNGFVIHTDGSGAPMAYHMLVKPDSAGDTTYYAPRFTGMALEAPGQPRVQIVDYQGSAAETETIIPTARGNLIEWDSVGGTAVAVVTDGTDGNYILETTSAEKQRYIMGDLVAGDIEVIDSVVVHYRAQSNASSNDTIQVGLRIDTDETLADEQLLVNGTFTDYTVSFATPPGSRGTWDTFEVDSVVFQAAAGPNTGQQVQLTECSLVVHYKALGLNEPLEYMYRYVSGGNQGDSGIHSMIVYPRHQSVLVSGFLPRPADEATTVILLYRRRIRNDKPDVWAKVDSFTMTAFHSWSMLDTGQVIAVPAQLGAVTATIATPGQPKFLASGGGNTGDSGSYLDSQYYVRYSWYDPVLDIESPMGPISIGDSSLAVLDTDSNTTQWAIGALADSVIPAPWIRVYQNVVDDAFVGAKDSLIWYRVYESPATKFRTSNTRYFVLGFLHDTAVVQGWSYKDYDTTYSDADHYDANNYSPAFDGSGFLRPPFIAGNAISYSDMEYANGRLWGIGDPLFPSRLYYSEYLRMDDWLVTNFLELGESDNDEIVAVEVLSSGTDDILYALKRNAVYAVVGFDVERDAYLNKLKATAGPVDKRSVITYNNQIFYLGTDMRIYRISGNQVQEISQRIEDQIDDLFTDYFTAIGNVRTFRIDRDIGWSNSGTGKTIMFNVDREIWWIITFANYTPDGFFIYDERENRAGFDPNRVALFDSDSLFASTFRTVGGNYRADTGGGGVVREPLVYQTPFIGDGEYLYQIQSIDLTADWPNATTMTVYIVDEEGTLLDSLDVTSDSRSTRLYRIGLPTNIGSYLAVRLRETGVGVDAVTIHSVKLNTRRVGRFNLE